MTEIYINERIWARILCLLCAVIVSSCSDTDEPLVCLPLSEANQTVDVKGGAFKFGDNRYYPDEGPVKIMRIGDFNIDKTEVTNAQFRAFVEATGYVTAAEKGLSKEDYPNIPPAFRAPGSMVCLLYTSDAADE